jgi:hypothetical protein
MFGINLITTTRLRELETQCSRNVKELSIKDREIAQLKDTIHKDRQGYAVSCAEHDKQVRQLTADLCQKNRKLNEQSILIDQQAKEIAEQDRKLERLTDRDEKGRFVKREAIN